jgi:hypothetical protein
MSSSRRGGTKLLNLAGASGKETHTRYACLAYEEKGDVPMKHASRILGMCVSFLLNMHKNDI